LLVAQGHLGDAERLLRATLTADLRVLSPDDRDVFGVQFMLAETLLQEHRPREAEVFARQAFEGQLRTLGPQNTDTFRGLNRLGRSLAALGRYQEAESLYRTTIDTIAAQPKSDPSRAWYDFGVMAAEAGYVKDAFDHLMQAAALGYKDVDTLENDEDLKTLRGDVRFARLVQQMQNGAHSHSATL
jgi:tetratricopeptide (TPR) repeat protein